MKVIEVPIFNDDGSVRVVQVLSAEEVQTILEFACNFLMTAGLAGHFAVINRRNAEEEQLDMFPTDPDKMQ